MNPAHGCERVRGRLERYVDGTLAPLERALDAGHLEACAACRAELAQWQALLDRLGHALRPETGELDAAVQGVEQSLAGVPVPRLRWRHLPGRVLVPLATAAAAVLLLLVLQWTGGGLQSVASLGTTELVPDLELRLPAWSNVVDEIWTPGDAR